MKNDFPCFGRYILSRIMETFQINGCLTIIFPMFGKMILLSMILPFLFCFSAAAEKHPNVVLFLCDDLGWADLPCYGQRAQTAHGGWSIQGDVQMPHLDRFASKGTRFTRFYVNGAVCSPSRAGIMTGRFPSSIGAHDFFGPGSLNPDRNMPDYVDPNLTTLADVFKSAGYATGHFGKWHLNTDPAVPPVSEYGFDEFNILRPSREQRATNTAAIVDASIDFMERNADTPFFLNIWIRDPHAPLLPTEEQLELYAHLSPKWGDQYGGLQVYYSVLTELDRQFGRLMARLDELGLAENTLVIFTSDNGPVDGLLAGTSHYGGATSANHGPFRGAKRSLYDGGVRMPFVARFPGQIPEGQLDETTLFSGVDLLPSFAALAGAAPVECDGEDVSAIFRGQSVKKEKPLFWENRFPVYGAVAHQSPMLAVCEGQWKLLMNPDGSRVELYDSPNDPSELNNVAHLYPGVVSGLKQKLMSWHSSLKPGFVHHDAGKRVFNWPEEK